jgi:hypothetical protein
LEQKLQQEIDHLATSRFERAGSDTVQSVGKGEHVIVPIRLEAGVVYAIVAACGEGCDHVEIALFDPAQNLLHRSPETSDVVIVSGPPQQSGVHGIALSAPGCRNATCQVGLVLLKQTTEPPPTQPQPEARAPPVAPQAAPTTPSTTAAAPPNADAETLRIFSQLVNLGVTVRDAVRAKERAAAAVAAPIPTTANDAPGKPAGFKAPQPKPQTPPAAPQPAVAGPAAAQRRATPADCRLREQQYYAAARTSGAPGTIGPLLSMYQYLQCNCGHPPSPQLPPCPR